MTRNLIGLARDFVIGIVLVILIGRVAGWSAGENYGLKAGLWIGGVLVAAVAYNVVTRRRDRRAEASG
jgi:hypothetical protein